MSTMRWPSRVVWMIFILVVQVTVHTLFPQPALAQEGGGDEHREVPGLDVIMVVDESETMWNQTDIQGVRVNTVDFFIDMLASEQSGALHRLGIVAFGTEPVVIPYTLLDSRAAAEDLKEQYAAVHQRIAPRKNTQYTDINKALRAALDMMEQGHDPDRKPALVLVTDGQPTAPQVSEARGRDAVSAYLEETRGLLEQLQDYPYMDDICPSPNGAPLHMIGLGVDNLQESSSPEFIALYREFWQGVSGRAGGYYKEAGQVQEMQGIGTYIFSELLCAPATPSVSVRSPQVLEYQVYDSYFQILFTISGKQSAEVVASIYRPRPGGEPGGAALARDDEGVTWQSNDIDYEVWGVSYTEPWTGTWQVVLEGDGAADFSYVFFPDVTLKLVEPSGGFVSADEPFTIRAGILDEAGQLVDVPVRDFQVELSGEEGFRQQLALEREGDTYVARLDPLKQTGEYSLVLHALLPDGTPLYEHQWVTLISAPWVELTEPARSASYTLGESIPLQASVHLAGAASYENIRLIADLLRDGEPVQTVEMRSGDVSDRAGENVVAYDGDFQAVEQGGAYEVRAEMMVVLPGGRVFYHEVAPIPLSILVPPDPTPSPSPSPTPVPTASPTSVPTALPPEAPTPTPSFLQRLHSDGAPSLASLLASVTGSPLCVPAAAALILMLVLLALVWMLVRRRRRAVPEKIKLLAELMHSRRESEELPYTLVLGSGSSVTLGCGAMKDVVKAIAGRGNGASALESFYETLDGLSPLERYVMLRKHFSEAGDSQGYRHLAELIKMGVFNVVFTTNLDSFLEKALQAEGLQHTADFQVLVCGKQEAAQTADALESSRPRVKIVKLHGDVASRSFAFTPSEISVFGSESERILRRHLSGDLIVIGHGPRDYDLNRAIEREGGAIWYVGQNPPPAVDPLYQAMRARGTHANVISGKWGLFDRFLAVLRAELTRS